MVLVYPLTTEKTQQLIGERKYTFRVDARGNKSEVKKEIERLYKVNVKTVHIFWVKSKKRRLGRIEGRKPGFKKAIVTLQEGHTIEV